VRILLLSLSLSVLVSPSAATAQSADFAGRPTAVHEVSAALPGQRPSFCLFGRNPNGSCRGSSIVNNTLGNPNSRTNNLLCAVGAARVRVNGILKCAFGPTIHYA
jgi:hypothetical protein